ncbi:hypothetical protein Vadar_029023 [Vaccinium darrowii]|uniref:Uncharacterized protein n=1 Tax=Vaccinium darrowii TaxID=229202 RepID=A0ACB7Z6Y2_9ERIC|nr:hypothetical protein Vadar_029023 [Vaccinium darrowii]
MSRERVRVDREGWSIVTRRRASGRHFAQASINDFMERRKVFTVYVDNLSEDMDSVWLGQIFSKYGHILDVFIPKKKSKGFKSKFGFVRYGSIAEAKVAITEINGIIIRDMKMFVKMATFNGSKGFEGEDRVRNSQFGLRNGMNVDNGKKVINGVSPIPRSENVLSYADAVVGKSRLIPKRINIKANPNEWLTRSVVAKLKSIEALDSIKEAIHCRGVPEMEIKDMGGLWVVLTLPTRELMLSLFDGGGLSWFNNWLDDIKQWSPDLTNTRRRNVWISCYGVPLHGWSAVTFKRIGQLWGEVVAMEPATVKGLSFAAAKIMIATEKWENINEIIHLEVQQKTYEVRVIEEQVVVQGHCSFCNIKSTVSDQEGGSPVKTNDSVNSVNDSVDEMASRRALEEGERLSVSNSGSRVEETFFTPNVEGVSKPVPSSKEKRLPPVDVGIVGDAHEVGTVQRPTSNTREAITGPVLNLDILGEASSAGPKYKNKEIVVEDAGEKMGWTRSATLKFADGFNIGPIFNNLANTVEAGPSNIFNPLIVSSGPPLIVSDGGLGKSSTSGRRLKSWEEILGVKEIDEDGRGGGRRRRKTKQVVFRSAAAAVSLTLSSEGIRNRNRILLDEAQAVWAMGKIVGGKAASSENEIISKLVEIEDDRQNKRKEGKGGV